MTSQLKKWGMKKNATRLEDPPAPADTMCGVGTQFLDSTPPEDIDTEPREAHDACQQSHDNSSADLLDGVEFSEEEWDTRHIDLGSPLSRSMLSLRDHVTEQFERIQHRHPESQSADPINLPQYANSTLGPSHDGLRAERVGENFQFESSMASSNLYDDKTIGHWSHSMLGPAYNPIEDSEFRISPNTSSSSRGYAIDGEMWNIIPTPEDEVPESENPQWSLDGQEFDSLWEEDEV